MDNMSGKTNNFTEFFKKLYMQRGYLDKYFGDILITAVALFCFFIALSYFYVMSKTEPIKAFNT